MQAISGWCGDQLTRTIEKLTMKIDGDSQETARMATKEVRSGSGKIKSERSDMERDDNVRDIKLDSKSVNRRMDALLAEQSQMRSQRKGWLEDYRKAEAELHKLEERSTHLDEESEVWYEQNEWAIGS